MVCKHSKSYDTVEGLDTVSAAVCKQVSCPAAVDSEFCEAQDESPWLKAWWVSVLEPERPLSVTLCRLLSSAPWPKPNCITRSLI